jgi:hypothetical protein
VHRILITNSFLYKCGLKETELCTFCTETKESLVHIFWECNYVWNFWLSIGNFLKICGLSLPFNAKDINRGKRFLTRQIPTSCLPKSGGIIGEHYLTVHLVLLSLSLVLCFTVVLSIWIVINYLIYGYFLDTKMLK